MAMQVKGFAVKPDLPFPDSYDGKRQPHPTSCPLISTHLLGTHGRDDLGQLISSSSSVLLDTVHLWHGDEAWNCSVRGMVIPLIAFYFTWELFYNVYNGLKNVANYNEIC